MNSGALRLRVLLAGASVVCVATAALVASPAPSGESSAGEVRRISSGSSSTGETAVAQPLWAPAAASVRAAGPLVVSDVVMVANEDGSATLSAAFEGGEKAVSLTSVHITAGAEAFDVASTQMWLPIRPGEVSRAGDPSDAGGFVVPKGLTPGQVVTVQLQFDDGTCVSVDAETVRRGPEHAQVFPTDGDTLGPGRPTVAQACASGESI
ncbi:hypothetical protein [Aeromicrobium sp. NPDC092404]|uniref:hypothetical protein n=1 Tax=Aeromicrobium sp. NPDC092404 TaxID=3154976 RepID=UPI00342492DB